MLLDTRQLFQHQTQTLLMPAVHIQTLAPQSFQQVFNSNNSLTPAESLPSPDHSATSPPFTNNSTTVQIPQGGVVQQPGAEQPCTPEVARAFVALPKAPELLTPISNVSETETSKKALKRASPCLAPAPAPTMKPEPLEIKEELPEEEEICLQNNGVTADQDLPEPSKDFDIGILYDDVMQCVYDDVASTGGDLEIFSNEQPPAPPERIRTSNGGTNIGITEVIERPLPQKPKSQSVMAKFAKFQSKKKVPKEDSESIIINKVVEANNKKNASLFARLFTRSKSQTEEEKPKDKESTPPSIPDHKTNEEDLFEMIENAEIIEASSTKD